MKNIESPMRFYSHLQLPQNPRGYINPYAAVQQFTGCPMHASATPTRLPSVLKKQNSWYINPQFLTLRKILPTNKAKNQGDRSITARLPETQCSCFYALFSCNFSGNWIAETTLLWQGTDPREATPRRWCLNPLSCTNRSFYVVKSLP